MSDASSVVYLKYNSTQENVDMWSLNIQKRQLKDTTVHILCLMHSLLKEEEFTYTTSGTRLSLNCFSTRWMIAFACRTISKKYIWGSCVFDSGIGTACNPSSKP